MEVFGENPRRRPFFGKVLLRKTVPCVGQKKKKIFSFSSLLGDSPSGKAPGSGPGIRGFESLIPSHFLVVS